MKSILIPLLALGLFSNGAQTNVKKAASTISDADICFYENDKVKAVYGEEDVYKYDQVLNVSGIDWVFSNFAYGYDEAAHQTIDHKSLYCDYIWKVGHNLTVASLDDSSSPFYSSTYKEEYRELLTNRTQFNYQQVIMSKDYLPANSIEDITLFTHYSTGSLGVALMIKPEGGAWTQLYGSGSNFMSHYAGDVGTPGYVGGQTVNIDSVPYTRYFNSYFTYNNDAKIYHNFSRICGDAAFKFAFVFQASNNYEYDLVLDGIVVNQKEAIKNYLGGLLDKAVCGNEFDKNAKQSFTLIDRIITQADKDYLASEYHSGGSISYYKTYVYLKDKIDYYDSLNDSSNGTGIALVSEKTSTHTPLIFAGISIAIVALYYLIQRKRKTNNI